MIQSSAVSDIEVVEVPGGAVVELVLEPDDPLVGATVTAVTVGQTPGAPQAGQAYAHVQTTPAAVWLILHPLPFTPSGIEVYDDVAAGADGHRMYPQRTTRPAPGRVRLDFTRPVSGTARLS